MQEIHGTVMHYPWGTADAIPAILVARPGLRTLIELPVPRAYLGQT